MIKNARIVGHNVNPSDYHRQEVGRGQKDFFISPSALKEFGRCPSRWLAGYNPPDSDAKAWGNLLDTRLLTPQLFEQQYAITPATYTEEVLRCPTCGSISDAASCRKCKANREPFQETKDWSPNTSYCRDWRQQQQVAGREVVSLDSISDCDAAIERLRADETIASYLDASQRQAMVVATWEDESGVAVPVRCLIDLVPHPDSEFRRSLGDLKTSRTAAAIPFSRHVYEYGYHIQAAFDLDLYVAATGEDRGDWCLLVQESFAPWQTGKRLLSQDFIELGRVEYRRLLRLYARCLKSGVWPGYDDNDEAIQGWTLCAPDPWMAQRAMFAPKFQAEKTELANTEENDDLIP